MSVATVVVLFPFIPKLQKLVCILVKDSAEELEDEADFDLPRIFEKGFIHPVLIF